MADATEVLIEPTADEKEFAYMMGVRGPHQPQRRTLAEGERERIFREVFEEKLATLAEGLGPIRTSAMRQRFDVPEPKG